MTDVRTEFDRWFIQATNAAEHGPIPYQRTLALDDPFPRVLRIPTGLGKTQALLGAWLWRRRFAEPAVRCATPRRLIYCLPMRVLVEQTQEVAKDMLGRLGLRDDEVAVHLLMGGEAGGSWDVRPERDAILIGTQDLLLSRALNRGYAMSRYRWPIHFALLNDDALWVVDEPQLFGAGLPTTAQLAAFRRRFGTFGPTQTIWASATLEKEWLRTVDIVAEQDLEPELALRPSDFEHPVVQKRLSASKKVSAAGVAIGAGAEALAKRVNQEHRRGTRTIVVVNTVRRAREIYQCLVGTKAPPSTAAKRHKRKVEPNAPESPRAEFVLIHSRFRPDDRRTRVEAALAPPSAKGGTIIVSTQVIEAGVDVSCTTLFTELAPWVSIVQRLGRCNRKGEDPDARVFFCELPAKGNERKAAAEPYVLAEIERAEEALSRLSNGSPAAISALDVPLGDPPPAQVIRARDLVELFDTTPDLSGADVDVSRFIRDGDERSVHVFWQDFDEKGPPPRELRSTRRELCPCPIGELRAFLDASHHQAWRWDLLEKRKGQRRGQWVRLRPDELFPGLVVLLHSSAGGYSTENGWDPDAKVPVPIVPPTPKVDDQDDRPEEDRSDDDDPLSARTCRSLRDHAEDTASEAKKLVEALPSLDDAIRALVVRAARWHDLGKAHEVFQETLRKSGCEHVTGLLAKSPPPHNTRHSRPGFRHELASALAALMHGESDVFAYLLAAHHGKVRLRIRSQPNEKPPKDSQRLFARGIWDGDKLPEVDLGDGQIVPPTELCLDYMRLGESERAGESWTARMVALRDDPRLGPFRLAFLEALVRAADERASGNPGASS